MLVEIFKCHVVSLWSLWCFLDIFPSLPVAFLSIPWHLSVVFLLSLCHHPAVFPSFSWRLPIVLLHLVFIFMSSSYRFPLIRLSCRFLVVILSSFCNFLTSSCRLLSVFISSLYDQSVSLCPLLFVFLTLICLSFSYYFIVTFLSSFCRVSLQLSSWFFLMTRIVILEGCSVLWVFFVMFYIHA